MSHYTLTGKALLEVGDLLDTTIDQLLGQGLGYDDWKMELGNVGGFAWSEGVKNVIIKKEFSFFREEILRLQSEPNTTPGLKSKTNSLESILKRLQGLEWVKGIPDEMEKRKRDGRLLGRDAKARCLQYHVSRWKSEAASAFHQPSTASSSSKLIETRAEAKEFETISSKLIQGASTDGSTSSPTFSNDDIHLDSNSFAFHKLSNVESADVSSIFGHTAQAPASDPTLLGDREIPWVPHTHSYEIGADGADITLEDFFRFVEQDPNFPVEPLCEGPYFELPRGNGINDSCETYISQTRQDSSTHALILEEIIDYYDTESKQDVWPQLLTQDIKNRVGGSQLDQTICEGNTTFSERDPPQNDCRSVVESDIFCQNFGNNTLAQGINSALESSWEKDQEAKFRQPGEQNAVPDSVTTASQYPYDKVTNAHGNSLHHIEAELCKKRQQLAAAETIVSKLSVEVKFLEEAFAKQRRPHPRKSVFEVTPKPKPKQKRGNDGTPRLAKRLKHKADAPTLELGSWRQPNEGREVCCLQKRHVSTLENTSPTTVDGEERSSDQCLTQNNDTTIASDYGSTAVLRASKNLDLLFTQAVQNPGDCLPRSDTDEHSITSQQFDESDVTQSLVMQTPLSELLPWEQSKSSVKEISGFISPNNGLLNCRACSVGFMDGLDESIAWVA